MIHDRETNFLYLADSLRKEKYSAFLDRFEKVLNQNNIPYNKLHDAGYPSIGCEPCTRAVGPSEDPRSGRWWWEEDAVHKECGLHWDSIKQLKK